MKASYRGYMTNTFNNFVGTADRTYAGADMRRRRHDGLDPVLHRPHTALAGGISGCHDAPGDRCGNDDRSRHLAKSEHPVLPPAPDVNCCGLQKATERQTCRALQSLCTVAPYL